MAFPRISFFPDKRQRAFFVAILLLVTIFFVGFYFFYVPANKQNLHRYAFSILENVTVNTQQRYNDTYKLVQGRMKSDADDRSKKQELMQSVQITVTDTFHISTEPAFYFEIINGKRYFASQPANVILDALFAAHRDEIFESFLLLRLQKDNNEVLYADPSLHIGSDMIVDSLVANNKGALFSGIKDLRVRDLEYKMFFVPFNINKGKLALCGFVKTSAYDTAAYQLPVAFIYTLVILLLLLLISLPLIRIYTIGRHETIRFYDLLAVVASLFIGCTIITVIIIQVALLKSGDTSAKDNVQCLSGKIHDSFAQEIKKAYRQLDDIDTYMSSRLTSISPGDSGFNASDSLNDYLAKHKKDDSLYYSFDRVSWVDQRGKQFIKAEPEKVDPVYQNVQERKYFTSFQNNRFYPVPGLTDSTMALEGVYNWVNGKFRFILSKRSKVNNAFIATLSIRSYSLMSMVLPAGYGFCMIDEAGNVQLHSTEYRSLNENLLNQVGSSERMRGAMISRQATHFDEIDLYGRKHSLYITPVEKMPFYFVTFYDKGYIVPVNMRILIFSLAFCALFYLSIAVCWLVLFYRRYYAKPMLAAPAKIFSRAVPKTHNSRVYRRGAIFLLVYVVTLAVMTLISTFAKLHNNYLILVIVLLTPLNIILGLMVLIYAPLTDEDSIHLRPRAKLAMRGLLILFGITILVTLLTSFTGGPQLVIFQGIMVAGLGGYYRYAGASGLRPTEINPPFRYLARFSAFWMLLILCLAVLPAALFTWYSHNQEILQSVKKQQLYLANELQERKESAGEVIRVYNPGWLPDSIGYDLLYKKGIYRTHNDSIDVVARAKANLSDRKSYEEFYFDIANRISNTYYDPYSYPPLRDSATDRSWYWTLNGSNKLGFFYSLPADTARGSGDQYLQIYSEMPARYQVLKVNGKGAILTIIVVVLLIGLNALIQRLSERLFLKKYFLGERPDSEAGLQKLIAGYQAIAMANATYIAELQHLPRENEQPLPMNKKDMYLYEQQLVATMSTHTSFYNFIWRQCSDRQKYLLYQFARHGLMNGRNTIDINTLLKKGILFIDARQEEIQLFCRSFRAYILSEMQEEKVLAMKHEEKSGSTWRSLRVPFLLVLMLVASFVFFTQHDAWQRIIALVTGFGSIFPLLLNIFAASGKGDAKAG